VAAYEVLSSEPTLQVLTPEIVIDATRIIARAVESGVVFAVFVANFQPTAPDRYETQTDRIARALAGEAANWNQNATVPGVISIGMSQEVDAAGQLKDVALVIVQSTSGRSTAQVTVTPGWFDPQGFAAVVGPVRSQLDAIEATGPPTNESGITPLGVVVDLGTA
jgi:hypothetical protein